MISIASTQWQNPGWGPPPPHLFLDQTEAQRAKKFFWETSRLPPPPPPPSGSGTGTSNVLIKTPFQKAIYIYLKKSHILSHQQFWTLPFFVSYDH